MLNKSLIGPLDKGLLFVISAPAGTGKTTLVNMLVKEFPDSIIESCSTTTRKPRPHEISNQDYNFVTIEEFEREIKADSFLEYAKVFGNYYGTPKDKIFRLKEAGKHVILVIDTQGAVAIKKKIDATFIFIAPPSFEELKNRLFKRHTEDEEIIQKRLEWAKQEMTMIPHYDYLIVNEDLETSYQILRSIIIAEEHRRRETCH